MIGRDLQPQRREVREYSVNEIFRLAEKFRHLAKDLSEVFIQASRQQIVYRIESDPEEEETREKLHFIRDLGRRFRQRLARRNNPKPTLVVSRPIPPVEAKPVQQTPLQRQIDRVNVEEPKKPVPRPAAQPVQTVQAIATPKPAQAASLLEAAAKLREQLGQTTAPTKLPAQEEPAVEIKPTALTLSPEELPKYKKYRDIGEQLLDAKQFPHFRTLLDKAREELSKDAINLLEEFGRSKGFTI